MFPVESLPAAYLEERSAADQERFAKLQQEAMQRAQDQQKRLQQPQSQQQQQQQRIPTPHNITQQLLQRPPLSRPNSSGVLGNIFQGFVKAASASPSPCQSTCTTPTPGQAKQITTAELERIVAEQKRDADICAMPVW
ncbi:hypothetical protein LTR86_003706 [Recurvomyces mirabilis]|nr:hypothetical protein LTR86_003706 [Recurvomyces mirabilis]